MSSRAKSASEPAPLVLSQTDAERLAHLARHGGAFSPGAQILRAEIERAEVQPDHLAPDSVIGLYSSVELEDPETGARRIVSLVYPAEADLSAGRISVLTPVGAEMIGHMPGDFVSWPKLDGFGERLMRIVAVSRSMGGHGFAGA